MEAIEVDHAIRARFQDLVHSFYDRQLDAAGYAFDRGDRYSARQPMFFF